MFVPLSVRSPVAALYEYFPLIPFVEPNVGPQAGTGGNIIGWDGALLVIVPLTTAPPDLETVVPAVALPVTLLPPDISTPACVERTSPRTIAPLASVIVP